MEGFFSEFEFMLRHSIAVRWYVITCGAEVNQSHLERARLLFRQERPGLSYSYIETIGIPEPEPAWTLDADMPMVESPDSIVDPTDDDENATMDTTNEYDSMGSGCDCSDCNLSGTSADSGCDCPECLIGSPMASDDDGDDDLASMSTYSGRSYSPSYTDQDSDNSSQDREQHCCICNGTPIVKEQV